MTSHPFPPAEPEIDCYVGVNSKRLVAFFIDTVAIFLLILLCLLLTFFIGLFFLPVIGLTASFAYRAYYLAKHSATPGMRLLGMQIRYENGQMLDGKGAALHTGGFLISCALPILQLISIVLMLLDEKNRGLTDHILGTCAVKDSND